MSLSLPVEDRASVYNHLYHIQNKNYKYCILEYEVLGQNQSITSNSEFKPFHIDASLNVRYAHCLQGLQLCRRFAYDLKTEDTDILQSIPTQNSYAWRIVFWGIGLTYFIFLQTQREGYQTCT